MNVIVKFSFMEEWKSYKLCEICDLIPGFAFKSADFGDYSTKAIKIGDIQPPYVNRASMSGVNIEVYDKNKLSKFLVKRGDFVLAMTGATIGKIGRYIDQEPAYLNQRVLLFRPNGDVNPKFVYYSLLSPLFQQYVINHIDSETAQPNISGRSVSGYEIALPSRKEQDRIALILSTIDDKIELNTRINHNLEEQADCLISSAIETQSIGSAHLWDICSYVTERVNNDTLNNKNYISTDNMFANKGGIGIASTIPDGKCTSFKVRDVLVSNIRPYFKKIWRASFSGGCSNDVLCFRTTKGTSSFLYHLLRSDVFFDYVMSGAKGSKMPRGDKQHIMNWTIPVFEKAIITSLEDSLEVIDDRVAIIQEENRRLSAIRDSLLPMLMTNSIYINDLTC